MTLPQKARHTHLPIWCDATRLLVETENAVRKFPRYHKYAVGAELRRQAMNLCRSIVRAAAQGQAGQEAELERLVFAVEDIKTSIQLAKELQAFASFAEFARMAELAVTVGKQSGGWRKSARARARPVIFCTVEIDRCAISAYMKTGQIQPREGHRVFFLSGYPR